MKPCKKLSSDQKSELKTLIKLCYDFKEVRRRAQEILFLYSKASYKTIETLTQLKERHCFNLSKTIFARRFERDRVKRKGRPKLFTSLKSV